MLLLDKKIHATAKEVVQGDTTNKSLPPSCGHPRRLDLTSCDSILPRPDHPSDRKSAGLEDPTLVAFSVEKHTLLSAPTAPLAPKNTLKSAVSVQTIWSWTAQTVWTGIGRRSRRSDAMFSFTVGRKTSRCSGRCPNVSSPVSLRPHLGHRYNEKGYHGRRLGVNACLNGTVAPGGSPPSRVGACRSNPADHPPGRQEVHVPAFNRQWG